MKILYGLPDEWVYFDSHETGAQCNPDWKVILMKYSFANDTQKIVQVVSLKKCIFVYFLRPLYNGTACIKNQCRESKYVSSELLDIHKLFNKSISLNLAIKPS